MSLLMNALKKAETAKQASPLEEVQAEPLPASDAARDLAQELGLDPPSARPAVAADTSATTSDVHSSKQKSAPLLAPLELALESEAPLAARSAPPAAPMREGSGFSPSRSNAANLGSARAAFSAKTAPSSKSRAPFFSLVGLCLAGGAGYGYYVWSQLQPPTRPPIARVAQPAAPAPSQPVAVPAAPSMAQTSTGNQPMAAMGATGTIEAPGSASGQAMPAPSAGVSERGATPDATTDAFNLDRNNARRIERELLASKAGPESGRPPRAAPQRDVASAVGGASVASPPDLRITRDARNATINPDVLTGYAALQAGDLDRANEAYERALRSEPANRDALLGAATVLVRLDRKEAAEAYFRQVLRLNPSDTYATAQLATLAARTDPIGALSQVNSMIARESERPDGGSGSGALAFVQGNQLAAQGRWPEAQQAYFNAHRSDPANADFCYNLAISLDHMRESRLARDFYSKALELARSRPASFDVARARSRLAQIESNTR